MSFEWEITLTVKDEQDRTSFINFYIENFDEAEGSLNLFASVETAVQDIVPFIDGMITGLITRISIGRAVALPSGLKTLPSLVSDVEEKGVFVFETLFGRTTVTLPTFKDSLVLDGSDQIDTFDPDVVSFVFRMTDGDGTPLEYVRPSDNRGNVIFSLLSATEKFRSNK